MSKLAVRSCEEIEAEIMKYRNVPVKLAAEYLGMCEMEVRLRIQDEKNGGLPIGSAFKRPGKKIFHYHISPYRLINHQGRGNPQKEEYMLGLA
jgi:hypothetical protein